MNRTTQRAALPDRTGACAPEPQVSSCRTHATPPPEPSMTAHGMEYPTLFGQAGVGSVQPVVPLPGFW